MTYPGGELDLFSKAHRWKAYWRERIAPYVHGAVLEVGAGIGANTAVLAGLRHTAWACLEPDPALAGRIEPLSERHEVLVGTLADLPAGRRFDCILYLDVLEHIGDDRQELERAADHLNPGGTIVVLAPALGFLNSPFDQAIGHYRRYNRALLRAAAPAGVREERIVYLDSCGILASLGNRVLLKRSMPSERQILTWDSYLVPCSRWLDSVARGNLGKSILGVWSKQA